MGYEQEIRNAVETAFIDRRIESNLAYKPQLITNNAMVGKKVLSSIEDELLSCDSFLISVAFITQGGIEPLLQTLKELEQKQIQGKILTTDYKVMTDPVVLKKLHDLKNIELRIYHVDEEEKGPGFHTKGYVFQKDGIYRIIVGSSNITGRALTTNKEWNTELVSTENGEFVKDILDEFNSMWNDSCAQSYEEMIDQYMLLYKTVHQQREIARQQEVISLEQYKLKPNSMQLGFIENLTKIREAGKDKALLISATGTGKTYASAFALREENPKKVLFVVHRAQIDRQAIESYQRVFGKTKTFGLLTGNEKETDKDFVFSTIQTLSKPEIYRVFTPDEFNFIVIDEAHRAGAESYRRIMNYFHPEFWLGMTASPDRTDGYDIYKLFDHNIAYEIRLQQAMEENLLCPFHYFGITDLKVDGKEIDDKTDFNHLVTEERVRYILEKADYYGYSGSRVKGLIFCSRKEEAGRLAELFNEHGVRSEFVCGDDSQEKREECINRLVSDDRDDYLQYIFTVDIFNEGVDIPEINQIIMLRPTQSPIIFIQQLGRGLRKADHKEFVVVLDFIGNYEENYMIPVALSGDRSYNKDNMRRYVAEGTRIIPGSSSIHFDEIARKKIYSSIDHAKTNDLRLIKESYQNLKYKLGHIPSVLDFDIYGAIDITKVFDKCGSYYAFLAKYEPEYKVRFSKEKAADLEFICRKLAKGKRADELKILNHLIAFHDRMKTYYIRINELIGMQVSALEEASAVRVLTNGFGKEAEKEKYRSCVFIEKGENGGYRITEHFSELLKDEEFCRQVEELLDFGILRNQQFYGERYHDTALQLYQKYTYEDVCRLLNWKVNMNAQNIGGYFYDRETKTLPVFINYEKAENAIAYEDRFISSNELIALSKHPRKTDSADANHIFKRMPEDKDNRIYLFIRKNKDDQEAKEFYFLGEMKTVGDPQPVQMEATHDDAFEIEYHMDVPVRDDIYAYLMGE